MKNNRILYQNLFSGIIIAMLFFVSAELVLRFSPWESRLGPQRFYGGIETLSMFWDPHSIVKIPSDELRFASEFRGRKVHEHKPADTYRILCVGGSFVYGWPYNNMPSVAYPAQLEQLLSDSAEESEKFEVINAGIGGYSSCQGLFYFKNRLYKLAPDLVIVCFGANDSSNNHAIGVFCSDKEYYESLLRLSRHKALFGIKKELNKLRTYALIEKLVFNIKKIFIRAHNRVPPEDFRNNLQEFITMAKEQGFKILFVLEPHVNLLDFEQEVKKDHYYSIMHRLAKENPGYVRLVDTISLIRKYQDKDVFYDEMHLLPSGHRALAELIFEVFQKSGFYDKLNNRGDR